MRIVSRARQALLQRLGILMCLPLILSTTPSAAANRGVSKGLASTRLITLNAVGSSMSLVSAQTPRSGAIATWERKLVGLQLKVSKERIDIPRGVPFSVKASVWLGDREATQEEQSHLIPQDAELSATFTGPGILSPLSIVGTLSKGLPISAMDKEGDYLLSDIRLQSSGATIVEADPKSVQIHCLGEILISQVTSTPMTMTEIRNSGIQLEPGSYEGRKFTLALSIGSQKVDLTVPVVVPTYSPDKYKDAQIGTLEIRDLQGIMPDVSVVMANITAKEDPFLLSRPSLSHIMKNSFKALIVIPGSIGYLHQFYKVNLVIINVLGEGSPYQVSHLSATIKPPAGLDGAVGTDDDPLRLAPREGESDAAEKPILGPDEYGNPGAGDSVLKAGESGMATFYLEGLKEGSHAVHFDFSGQFEGGGLESPVPLSGTAEGKILVRNPNFSLVLVHPDVVRRGETYTLEAHLTNTSQTLANGVSINLDQARLGGVKLVSSASDQVDTLAPGETHVFTFQLKALRNGEVRSSYLYVEGGGGSFSLSTGLGERSIRLNPDTLVLPKTLDMLPIHLRDAMLRVMGQAYSIASTKSGLPFGVLPIPSSVVTGDLARDLSEQGMFLRMGVDRARVWSKLWQMFTRNPDPGFDQLMRTTQAGAELRQAFLEAWSWVDASHGLMERLYEVAQYQAGMNHLNLVALRGAKPGLVMSALDGSGNVMMGGTGTSDVFPAAGMAWAAWEDTHLLQVVQDWPGLRVSVLNVGTETQTFELASVAPIQNATPTLNHWSTLELAPGNSAVIDLGALRGAPLKIVSKSGSVGPVPATEVKDLEEEPFQVIAVHRYDLELDAMATPFGTHLMVLFNRPNQPLDILSGDPGDQTVRALVQVEGNQPLKDADAKDPVTGETPAAMVQAFSQAVSLYLQRPVGPYVPRALTLSSQWRDVDGTPIQGSLTWPIQCGQIPGGAVVRGKVRKASGEALPSKLNYYYLSKQTVLVDEGDGTIEEETVGETFYARIVSGLETDSNGNFQIDYVPEPIRGAIGPFLLKLSSYTGMSQYDSASNSASVLGNGETLEMDVVLEGTGTVEGYVRDAQGQPVSGAGVQIDQVQPSVLTSGGTYRVITTTDADGHYRAEGLKVGVFSIRVLKGLYGVAVSNQIPRDGAVVVQDILLNAKTGTIRARLLDAKDQPVKTEYLLLGIPYGILRSGGGFIFPQEALPGPDGWVTFNDVPPGDVQVKASRLQEDAVLPYLGYLDPGAALEVTLHVVKPADKATARVIVVDFQGHPVEGASVKTYTSDSLDNFVGVTDETGRIPDRQVLAGITHQVYAQHPDWPEIEISNSVTPHPGETFELHVIMPAKSSVEGHVTRADGSPVKGAYVAFPPVCPVQQNNRLSITDDQGHYQISNGPRPGTYRLAAVGPELRTATNLQIPIEANQAKTVDIILPLVADNVLQGRVLQPAQGSQPPVPAMAHVWITAQLPSVNVIPEACNDGWGLLYEETLGMADTTPDGTFTFRGLPAGEYTLHANSDFFPVVAQIKGTFGDQTDVAITQDITLISSFAGEIEGTVYGKDGQTQVGKGMRVRLIGGSIGEIEVATQDAGKYQIPKVIPQGDYFLRAEDPQTGDFTVESVKLTKDAKLLKNLRLWGKGVLTVHAEDNLGKPLSDGVVTLQHSKTVPPLQPDDLFDFKSKLSADAPGLVIFEDVLEGMITVTVATPSGNKGIASASIPEGGGDREVTVRLEPLGSLRGRLTRADGSPVTAGNVTVSQGKWLGVSTTRQDDVDGRFRFENLPVGQVELQAWDPDSRQTGHAVATIVANSEIEADVQTQDLGQVAVHVTQEGKPVDHASLRVSGRTCSLFDDATTDAAGQATFYLPPEEFLIEAIDPVSLAKGSITFKREINQAPIQLEMLLTPVRSLLVRVTPPHGAPEAFSMEGWTVQAENMGRAIHLDASGQGLIRDLSVGIVNLQLTDNLGRLRGVADIPLTTASPAIPTAVMQALAIGSLRVSLTESDGTALLGSIVEVWEPGATYQPIWSKETDISGQALFQDLVQGEYKLIGRSPDYFRSVENPHVAIVSEGVIVDSALSLKGLGTMKVKGLSASGDPMANLQLHLSSSNSSHTWDALTDASGEATITQVPEGQITVSAIYAGKPYQAVGTLAAKGTLELTIQLTATTRIAGAIKRASAALWPEDVRAYVLDRWYPLNTDGTLQSTQGEIDCTKLVVPVSVYVPGMKVFEAGTVTLVPGGQTLLDLTAPGFGSLQAKVTLAGQPVPSAVVYLDDVRYTTDADGLTPAVYALLGTHRLQVSTKDGMAWTDVQVQTDGQSQVVPLPLQNNAVALPASLTLERLGLATNLSFTSWLPALAFGLDGASPSALALPPQGYWLIPGRSLAWEQDQGDLHVTRIFESTGYGLREQLVFQNRGTAAHAVSLSAGTGTLQTGQDPQLGTAHQTGGAWFNGSTVAWGKGAWVPTSLIASSYYSAKNTLLWPALTLDPGQSYSLWLGCAPHGQGGYISSQGDQRFSVPSTQASAERALQRMIGQAPEWIQDLDPRISNSDPAPTVTDALPAWDGVASLNLIDPQGQPVQALGTPALTLTVIPKEPLAPQVLVNWRSSSSIFNYTFQLVPPDGLSYSLSTQAPLQGDLAWGQSLDLKLGQDWAVAQFTAAPNQMGNHYVSPLGDSQTWSSSETLNAGIGLRWTTQAKNLTWFASQRDNTKIRTNGTTALALGALTPIQIQFPAYGSLLVQGPATFSCAPGWSCMYHYLTATSGNDTVQSREFTDGGYLFPALPAGAALIQGVWNFGSIQVQEGVTTTWTVPMGSLQVTGLDVNGLNLSGYFAVVLTKDGITHSVYNGAYGYSPANPLMIADLPVGDYTVGLQDPLSGVVVSTAATVSAEATTPVTLRLGQNGSLSVTLQSAAGTPMAGLQITAAPTQGSSQYVSTNTSGFAHFLNLGTGAASITYGHVPGADPNDEPGSKPSLVTLAPGSDVPVTLTVPSLGSVTVHGLTQAGDALPNEWSYSIPNAFKSGRRTIYNSRFQGVVLGQPLLVRFGDGNNFAPVDAAAVIPNADGQALALTFPIGRLRVRLRHQDQSPLPNVQVALTIPGATNPQTANTDATGIATFTCVPLGAVISCNATSGGSVQAASNVTFTGPDQLVDLLFPSTGQLSVRLNRTNPDAVLNANGWNWTIYPGSDFAPALTNNVLSEVFTGLYEGTTQTVTATLYLNDSLSSSSVGSNSGYWYWGRYYSNYNSTWTASLTQTIAQGSTEGVLTLPARASATLVFQDAQGQRLTRDMYPDSLTVKVKESTNAGILQASSRYSSFDNIEMSEVFTEGTHVLGLTSSLWGDLPDIKITVNPQDDGTQLRIPVLLPWVKTDYSIQVVAGDHETPVACAGFKIVTDKATEINTGGMSCLPDENSRIEGSFWGPASERITLQSSYTPLGGTVVSASRAVSAGPKINEILELPLTVIRTLLTEKDGRELARFETTCGFRDSSNDLQRAPHASLGGKEWALLLGQPAGSELSITLGDYRSGLGKIRKITIPALPDRVDVIETMPDSAWLTEVSLQLDPGIPASYGECQVTFDQQAAGLVRPDRAVWIFSNGAWQHLDPSGVISISEGGFAHGGYGSTYDYPSDRIRVPLSGTVWSFLLRDSSTSKGSPLATSVLQLSADQTTSLIATQPHLSFVATPLNIQVPQGVNINDVTLQARMVDAPADWCISPTWYGYTASGDGGPDAQGLWHPKLPAGVSVHLEAKAEANGHPWQSSLDLVPTDPAPAVPFTLGAGSHTGQLQLTVLGVSGQPQAYQEQVRITTADGNTQSGRTDDKGVIVFSGLAVGSARVLVTNYSDGLTASLDVVISDAATTQATIQLSGSGSLQVSLTTVDGRPVQGRAMQVLLSEAVIGAGYTDTTGHLTLGSLPMNQALTLRDLSGSVGSPWNPKLADQTFTVSSNGSSVTTALVLPISTFTLTVREIGTSQTIASAYVYDQSRNLLASTDRNGVATIRNAPVGTAFSIVVTASGYQDLAQTDLLLSDSQPTGSRVVELSKGPGINLRVLRVNSQPAPGFDWWSNRHWDFKLSGGTTGQGTNSLPTYLWSPLLPGEYSLEASCLVRTDQNGSVSAGSGGSWPWTARGVATLDAANTEQVSYTLQLPALAAFTLHLKDETGQPLLLDRNFSIVLTTSTVPGFSLQDVNINPATPQGRDVVMAEHFPEGTHIFTVKDVEFGDFATFGITVTPADDGTTLQRDVMIRMPAMAALNLHLRDSMGRPLTQEHGLSLVVKQSSVAGYSPALGQITGSDPAFGQVFREGTHMFAVVDPLFGEVTTFDLTVVSSDQGLVLEKTIVLPYIHVTWNTKVVASDGLTGVPNALIRLAYSGTSYLEGLSGNEAVPLEVPSGTAFSSYVSFQPLGGLPEVSGQGQVHSVAEGSAVEETIQLPLSVARFRLLDQDGVTPFDAMKGTLDRPDYNPGDLQMPVWSDGQGTSWLLLLGQTVGSTQNVTLMDPDSGIGRKVTCVIPALGSSKDDVQQLPVYVWMPNLTFNSTSGSPSPHPETGLQVAISADAEGLVRPDLAAWILRVDGNSQPRWLQIQSLGFSDASTVLFTDTGTSTAAQLSNIPEQHGAIPAPSDCPIARVRVPVGATIWAMERNFSSSQPYPESWPDYWEWTLEPCRFGSMMPSAEAGDTITPAVAEATWSSPWVIANVQIQQQDGTPITSLPFQVTPVSAPGNWLLYAGWQYSSEGDTFTLSLPTGVPVQLETTTPGNCSQWFRGLLKFTPTDPPPADPFVLKTADPIQMPCNEGNS